MAPKKLTRRQKYIKMCMRYQIAYVRNVVEKLILPNIEEGDTLSDIAKELIKKHRKEGFSKKQTESLVRGMLNILRYEKGKKD